MKKELFLFVFLSVFITLIDLGTQIQGTQPRYTVVNFGFNQPLKLYARLKAAFFSSSILLFQFLYVLCGSINYFKCDEFFDGISVFHYKKFFLDFHLTGKW